LMQSTYTIYYNELADISAARRTVDVGRGMQ
jgi:hypothetical protein